MDINLFIVMAFGSKLPESHYFFNHGQSTIQWLVVLFGNMRGMTLANPVTLTAIPNDPAGLIQRG